MSLRGLWRWAEADPDRIALIEVSGRETSMAELAGDANRVVHALRKLGLEVGDGVAILLPNSREFLSLYLAAIQGGFIYTPLNYHLMPDEVAYVLGNCEAKAFVAHERYRDVAAQAVKQLGFSLDRCFSVGDVEGFRPLEEVLSDVPTSRPLNLTMGERLMYTSGTTGKPKGVKRPLPGVHPDEGLDSVRDLFGLETCSPMHLVTGPFYHGSPQSIGVTALHLGHTAIVMDRWNAEQTLRLIETHRVATSHMVPTMFHRLLALPEDVRGRYDLSSLETVVHGAAPISKSLKRRMIEWWGPVFYEYFGSTEVNGTGVSSQEWLEHPGTVGKPWPGCAVAILDEEGREAPPRTPGRIFMLSPRGNFEYFKAPDKTKQSVAEGFEGYRTVGDVGYLDEEGRLYPCDRAIDMIISGGVNIYPAEVENVLLEHPSVAEVAVFGVPNEEWGEEVKAVVELREGFTGSPKLGEDLISFARERIAHLKCPRTIEFRQDLPRAENGKLYKRLLREEYWQGRERQI